MIRALAPVMALALSACASAAAPPKDSYTLGRGIASYDELRRQTEQCNAQGGTISPVGQGGDPAQLSNYLCVIPKGR